MFVALGGGWVEGVSVKKTLEKLCADRERLSFFDCVNCWILGTAEKDRSDGWRLLFDDYKCCVGRGGGKKQRKDPPTLLLVVLGNVEVVVRKGSTCRPVEAC